MKHIIMFAAMAVALCACGTVKPSEPIVITKTVTVPVTVSCVPGALPAAPAYVDTDPALKAAPDAAARYAMVNVGRVQRIGRLDQLETVVKGCRK